MMRIFSRKSLFVTFFFGLAIGLTVLGSGAASALSGGEFKAGRIIDDAYFYNGSAMSAAEIQNFLNSKVSSCDTWGTQPYGGTTRAEYGTSRGYPPPYTCLKDYRQDTGYKAGASGLCSAIEAKTNRTAAQIIDDVAQACHISQKVIIVMLQKEQGLVTDDWPWSIQYRSAMGYGCPDTAPCDAEYYGFFNQVYNAALQFQRYKADPNSWNHVPFMTNQILYQANAPSCGSRSTYIENYATAGLYNYTPYTPNQAALDNLYGNGDSCSAYGNRNFWRYYNDWFGSTLTPTTFRADGSSTVYVMVGGYKVTIPAMYTLQDYGYDPTQISVVSQATNNSIPVPPLNSGISSTLGHVIKSTSDTDADGGSVYFVSVGLKYPIPSMDQFNKYGFDTTKITYLPLSFIQTIKTGTNLSDFLKVPDGTIFNVSATKKQTILSNATHVAINPSGVVNPVSLGTASLVVTGNPYSDNNAVFLKRATNPAVFAFNNGQYYSVDWNTYNCWGVGFLGDRTLRTLSADYLPATITASAPLNCQYKDSSNNVQLLDKTKRITIPAEYGVGVGTPTPPVGMETIFSNTPVSSTPLKRLVKSEATNTVWYIENGLRRALPTVSNFNLLGGSDALDTVENGGVSTIPLGAVKLASGQAIKTASSSTVFVVDSSYRYAIDSAEKFIALGLSWSNIEVYENSYLDANYPASSTPISGYLYVSSGDKTYFMDKNSCYYLDIARLSAYGQNQDSIKTAQPYSSRVAPYVNFAECRTGTDYIKSDSSGTVYKLESGAKRAISSWGKLLELNGGTAPNITILTQNNTNAFPNGSPY